jgi:hypothetical protein
MDWSWALRREETHSDVMGFGHTHPPCAGVIPSRRDVRTMRAWCSAFGKPLLCLIECNGCVQSTLFYDEEDTGHPLPLTQIFPRGVIVVMEGDGNGDQSA